jgi:hypothetical protein
MTHKPSAYQNWVPACVHCKIGGWAWLRHGVHCVCGGWAWVPAWSVVAGFVLPAWM